MKLKKLFAFVVFLAIFIEPYSVTFMENGFFGELKPSKFIDTLGHDGVIIDCPTYIAGVKSINVYSNKTVKNYELRLNGTLMNSVARPVIYVKGRWYADYTTSSLGENYAGTLRYCDVDDTNYLYAQTQTYLSDEFYDRRIAFGTGNLDTSYINATWIEYGIQLNVEAAGCEDKYLQYYRTSDSTWQTITTFTENAWNTGNVSLNVMSNLDAISKSFLLRIYVHEITSGLEAQTNIDYLRIYYTSTNVLSNDRDYSLLDTYAFNSSAKSDGVYNLTAKVRDFYGTWWSDTKWIVVDNTAPVISSITLTPPTGLNNTIPINIYTTISDTYLNYSYGQYSNGYTILQVPNTNNAIFNFTNFYTNRSYDFYLYAYDKAGNSAYKNKTFTVAFKKHIEYIQNPVIDVSHVDESFPGSTAWVNATCIRVGELKMYVNGTLNQTVTNPTLFKYGFNSTVAPRKFNVVLRFTYTNGTWYKNISFAIDFISIPITYINNPSIDLSYQANQYVNYTSWVNVTCQHVSELKMYVNGTLNQTVASPSTFKYGFNSTTPKTFNIVIRTTYSNGTFYRNDSFTIRLMPWVIQYIHNPAIDISYVSEAYVNQTAWINVSCVNVGEMKRYINGSLNATHALPSTVNYGLNSSTTKTFDITLRFTYASNGSWYKNISFIIRFVNYTYVYINVPSITILVESIANITEYNSIFISTEYLGSMNMTIYSCLNATTDYIDYTNSTNLTITLISYVGDVWNVTCYFNHPNDTLYDFFSFGIHWVNLTIIYDYINNPDIEIAYQSNQYVDNTAWLNVTTNNIGELKMYVNGTLNQTVPSPVSFMYGFNSTTQKTFDIVLRFTYASNGSWYKNVSLSIEFENVPVNQTFINNPAIDIGYQSKQMVNQTAWINVTCDYLSKIKLYVNGTLNMTYDPVSTGFNWSINSTVENNYIIIIETYLDNSSFYRNFTATIQFFDVETITEFMPEINIAYNSVQNITETTWINVSCNYLSKILLHVNGTLNATYDPVLTGFNWSITSSSVTHFQIVLETFYDNASFYKNFSIDVRFTDLSIVHHYVSLPMINIGYTARQQINNFAWTNVTFSNVQKINVYLNGTINLTYFSSFNWSVNSSIISTQSIVIESFYENGTWYKNFSFSIEFTNDITYIDYPHVSISSTAIQYVNRLAWVNISAIHVSLVDVYVNGTLNATYNSNFTSIAWSMNGTIPSYFNITISFYHENASFYKNFTVLIRYIEYTFIELPIVNIVSQNVTYVGQYANINITSEHVSLIKIFVNGTLNATYPYPSVTLWNIKYDNAVNLSVIIQTFYDNASFYKNFSTFITVKDMPFVNVYINNPNVDIMYQETQYVGQKSWVNVTFLYMSQVDIYVNGTFNATYASNFDWYILSNVVNTYNVTLKMYHVNASFYKQFVLLINFINYTIYTHPEVSIVCQTERFINNYAWVNMTGKHLGTTKFYVNGTINATYPVSTSINFSLYSSFVANFIVVIQTFYPNSTCFKNFSLDVSFVVQSVTYLSIILPSVIVSYPVWLYVNESGSIELNTTYSSKTDVSMSNGTVFTINGNVSAIFTVIPNNASDLTFILNVFYLNNTSWKNVTFTVLSRTNTTMPSRLIEVKYSNIVFIGGYAVITGSSNLEVDVVILEGSTTVSEQDDVLIFTFSSRPLRFTGYYHFTVQMFDVGMIVYSHDILITVVEPIEIFAEPIDPGRPDLFFFMISCILAAGIAMIGIVPLTQHFIARKSDGKPGERRGRQPERGTGNSRKKMNGQNRGSGGDSRQARSSARQSRRI